MKPRLARGVRVRPDPRDGAPILLSPERGLRLGASAAEVVAACDGRRTIDEIVDELAARHASPRERVRSDVLALLRDLAARGLVDDGPALAEVPPRPASPMAASAPPGPPRSPASPAAPGVAPDVPDLPDVPHAAAAEPEVPYTLVAELTHRCALACPYCSNPRDLVRGSDELATDVWLRVVDEAAALGVMQIHLSGGEPLARADLEAIAARARARDLYVNLVTSGVPLEAERLDRLAASLDHVQLSVQDAESAASDRIAGLPSFAQKMRVARWVKERGLPLTVNVVLHRENLPRIGAVIAMAEGLGADRLELANVQLVSWALENRAVLLPSAAAIEAARSAAADAKRRLEGRMQVVFVLPDWQADRPRACMDGWARRFAVVAPDGAVLPCHAARALPLRFDSVRDGSLSAIWRESPALRAFRGEAWMPSPCRTCDRRSIDFGGCRCQAFALTGDAAATDPACALAPSHGVVLAARREAEAAGAREGTRFVYRGR